MDLNTLLLWIAGSSCIAIIFTALRASPRSSGWLITSGFIFAVGGTTYLLKPEIAGYISGTLWAVLVLGPALTQKSARQLAMAQNYDRAAVYARIAGILHPLDGLWQQSQFLRAMSLADKGDTQAAQAIFRHLETTGPKNIARMGAVHARRMDQDWTGVISWIQTHVEPHRLLRDHSLLPIYIRALGEIGQLGEMLQLAVNNSLSHHPQLLMIRSSVKMFALAFSGQPHAVENTFHGGLALLPVTVQRYWSATAMYAAGMNHEAEQELSHLEAGASPGMLMMIQSRRANPPALATVILTPTDRVAIDAIELQQDQEQRFIQPASRSRRPWVTYALILANTAVFFVEWVIGATRGNLFVGGTMSDSVLNRLGAMNAYVLQSHEYYRIFMANFLHFGYAHIIMNMLALLFLGPFVEFSLGRIIYLLLYLASGVGVMVTMLFLPWHHLTGDESLVGASGAIMAVIGATAAILFRGWYRERAAAAGRRLRLIGFILILQVIFDHYTPQVSGTAHIAGMIWGFVLASLLPHRKALKTSLGFAVKQTAIT